VPNAPKTPLRSVRIDDDLWERTAEAAEARGTDRSEVVRAALEHAFKSRAFMRPPP
jgi:predicted transcriptional regulator